jgi:hypothetical protein
MIPLFFGVLGFVLFIGRREFAEILAEAMSRFFR